jgi:hypothetical protein
MRKMIFMACCLSILAPGCGGSNRTITPDQGREGVLNQVGSMYLAHQLAKNAAPLKLVDFNSVRAVAGNAYESIRTGEVVVRYGATLPDTNEEPGGSPSDEVLAFEKQVPESGGKVLLLNRTVKTMTADEFKSAKKAGKD